MPHFRIATKALVAVAALGFALTAVSGSASAFDKNSGTPEQRAICQPEAIKYCLGGGLDPNVITQCLKKDPRVSKACKAVVNDD
jgi:hypothetical protein